MRNPWYRIVIFALLLLLPLAAGEVYVRHLPNPSKSKHAFLKAHSREVEVLVLGSSHTYYGICPERLSPHAYSAAQVSQTLRYDHYLLHHYPFDRLKTVVQPISDFTFYEELEGGAEWYLANRYRLYMDCDLHSPFSVYNWEVTAFPVFCEKLKSLWQPPKMYWSDYGQGLEYTLEKREKNWNNGESRAATNHYSDFSGASENETFLKQIADFCRERNVQLILLSTPLSADYRAHQDPKQVNDMHRRVAELQQRYPETVYLDLAADLRFTDTDFYDADHLNTQGAEKLSAIVKPYLRPCPTPDR